MEEQAEAIAHRIANGHAYDKHGRDYGITVSEFERMILETILHASDARPLFRGRTAYWSDGELMVVIHEPTHPDAGTAFRPEQGKTYFVQLR